MGGVVSAAAATPVIEERMDGCAGAEANGKDATMANGGGAAGASDQSGRLWIDNKQLGDGPVHQQERHTHTQTNKDAVCRCWMLNSLVGRRQTNSSLSLSPRSSTEVKRP